MLIVEFMQYKNVLCGRVLAMSEDLRGIGSVHEYTYKGKTYFVSSADSPCLNEQVLYIMGESNSEDGRAFCYAYDSCQEAADAKQAFSIMIREINVDCCYEYQPEIIGG